MKSSTTGRYGESYSTHELPDDKETFKYQWDEILTPFHIYQRRYMRSEIIQLQEGRESRANIQHFCVT